MIHHRRPVGTLEQGLELDVQAEDFRFLAYLAVCAPDVDRVSELVPPERFEQDGDVHVAAIGAAEDAAAQIEEVAFNMSPGDSVVFLCKDARAYDAALAGLDRLAG
jgi:hypothetical protein